MMTEHSLKFFIVYSRLSFICAGVILQEVFSAGKWRRNQLSDANSWEAAEIAVIMSARGKHAGRFATRYSVYDGVFVCRQGIRAGTMRVEAERPIRAEDRWKCHSVSEEVNKPDPTSPECFFIKASHTHIYLCVCIHISPGYLSLLLGWIRWVGHCLCILSWAGGKGVCMFCRFFLGCSQWPGSFSGPFYTW